MAQIDHIVIFTSSVSQEYGQSTMDGVLVPWPVSQPRQLKDKTLFHSCLTDDAECQCCNMDTWPLSSLQVSWFRILQHDTYIEKIKCPQTLEWKCPVTRHYHCSHVVTQSHRRIAVFSSNVLWEDNMGEFGPGRYHSSLPCQAHWAKKEKESPY